MKILEKVEKQGLIKLRVENLDDLWYLSQIILQGDRVRGKSTRKVKAGEQEDAVKKTLTLQVLVERCVFQGDSLRIMGELTEGTEDIATKAHHTITATIGIELEIVKEQWSAYQKTRLEQAGKEQTVVLLVVFDREEARFAILHSRNYQVVGTLSGNVTKKRTQQNEQENFYVKVIDAMQQYVNTYGVQHIILASPAFWKDELMKELNNQELKRKIILAGCSSVSNNAFEEVLKRQEASKVLGKAQVASEQVLVETLLEQIGQDGLATYGTEQIQAAVRTGAVEVLLISTRLIKTLREKGQFDMLEKLMQDTENTAGRISIINAENEAGKQLDGLGGLGVLLRYKTH